MIQVKKLSKTFGSGDMQVQALKEISFTIETGAFASIIGKSGSGKSTLMALLGALDSPTTGEVIVGDRDITKLSGRALTKYRAKDIGFVFQGYNLIPNLTALENVMLPMEYIGSSNRAVRATELLDKVGISGDKQNRKPGRLSGGEQQRVAIARALANDPKLILADEPTGNLDSQNGKMIFDLLHNLARTENTTIIAVTHDLEIAGKTDQTFTLSDGRLERKGVARDTSIARRLGLKK